MPRERIEPDGIVNLVPVLGDHRSSKLPESSADVIVTVRVYHHFEYPVDMLASIKAALRPNGRFVVYVGESLGVDRLFVRRIDGTGDRILLDAGAAFSPAW